jgi:hypothetical protein
VGMRVDHGIHGNAIQNGCNSDPDGTPVFTTIDSTAAG